MLVPPLKIANTLANVRGVGNLPLSKLLLIGNVNGGAKMCAAILMILGHRPSIPVAFEGSSLLIKDNTWSHVISGK